MVEIEDNERYADPIDAGSALAETWLADRIAEHRYALEHAAKCRDIEAEICNGCSYATKTAWGKKCDSWVECRADVERKEKSDSRNGRN